MAAFKRALSNRPLVGAVLFVFLLCVLEELIFGIPQIRWVRHLLQYMDAVGMWFVFVSGIASFVICVWFVKAALESSRLFQVVYTLLFTLSLVIQYGYRNAVDRFIIPVDLRIALATPIHTWKGAGTLYFDWSISLPVVVFISCLYIFSERRGSKTGFKQLVSIFFLIAILNFSYGFTRHSLNLGLSFSSFYQTIARFLIDNAFRPKREMVRTSHVYTPQNNIVLIIDESIRADHMSINGYIRATTPFLDRLADVEDGFHNFGMAVSGATCSHLSNPLILTGIRPGLDDFEKTAKYPTIFQYAKAMGYKTYYMDAQTNSLWTGLTDQDISFVDVWSRARDFGRDIESDFRAADRIVSILSESRGNLIVLNKRGVHFLYEGSYPPDAAVWLPLPGDYLANPSLVPNSYDNSILYNVNTFFERLLINPEVLEYTVILYTSDHGQTLFENGATWMHCNSTPQEAIVPMILIGRRLPPLDDHFPASHSNILPTLLDLMNVPAEQRIHTYAPSLLSESNSMFPDRLFFDGGLRLVDFPDSYTD